MPQAPSTGSSLIRDPSIAHRNTQILWTEVDRDLAQDTRFTGMKQRESNYRDTILTGCKLSIRVSLRERFSCGNKSIDTKFIAEICARPYARPLCIMEMLLMLFLFCLKNFL